ncbi:MAG: DegV family protein [Epulopiscium sp.]|nr:DegV family protein [Candidatus Epulonipiscium sp.]
MGKVKIFTDSTADLSKELLEKYNISVVPLYVILNEKSYRDGLDLTTIEMYELIEKYQTLPKTSAPTVEDFKAAFLPWLQQNYEIVYIGISSGFSGTVQAATIAAKELGEEKVHIVDSLNLSMGIGLLAIEAAEMAQQGMEGAMIAKKVREDVPKVRSSFFIDTLKFLHMGGRCTSVQMLASTVLRIRPQIIVRDGGMIVGSKYRGNRKRCLESFYQDHIGEGKEIRLNRISVTHSACPPEEVAYLKEKIKKELQIEEVLETRAGTVISSHCGPQTIGVLYIQD